MTPSPALASVILMSLALAARASDPSSDQLALDFAKRVFRDLGRNEGNVALTVGQYQDEFDALSTQTNQSIGPLLSQVFQLRAYDLTVTLEHTLTMQRVISELRNLHDADPVATR